MLRMFLGKPGGGKSYGALLDIIEELVFGDRVVITNLALLLGELNAHIQAQYPEADVDIHKRIVLISKEETKRFWLIRGPGPAERLADVSKEEEKAGIFPDFAAAAGSGVLYVIDEAHVPFDARGWAESGQSLTYYNSQHRKLNDELIFVTQFLELVDKRIRGFAQDYRYFRNNGVERIFTFFRLPAYFTAKVYQKPPTGLNDYPSEVHRYRLDPAIAKCYDTSAGVGITGRRKPEQKQSGGLSVGWLALPAVGLVAGLWYLPEILAKGMARSVGYGEKKAANAMDGTIGSVGAQPSRSLFVGERTARIEGSSAEVRTESPAVTVRGVTRRGDHVNVVLSDGRTLTEQDGELQRIDRNGVVVNGRKLFFAQPGPRGDTTTKLQTAVLAQSIDGGESVIVPDSDAEEAKRRVASMLEGKSTTPTAGGLEQAPRVTPGVAAQVFGKRQSDAATP